MRPSSGGCRRDETTWRDQNRPSMRGMALLATGVPSRRCTRRLAMTCSRGRLPRSMATNPAFTGYLFSSHHHNAFLDAYSRASQIDDSMPPDTLSDSLTAGHHWIPRDAMDLSLSVGRLLPARECPSGVAPAACRTRRGQPQDSGPLVSIDRPAVQHLRRAAVVLDLASAGVAPSRARRTREVRHRRVACRSQQPDPRRGDPRAGLADSAREGQRDHDGARLHDLGRREQPRRLDRRLLRSDDTRDVLDHARCHRCDRRNAGDAVLAPTRSNVREEPVRPAARALEVE
jgi:hypothetical protein